MAPYIITLNIPLSDLESLQDHIWWNQLLTNNYLRNFYVYVPAGKSSFESYPVTTDISLEYHLFRWLHVYSISISSLAT